MPVKVLVADDDPAMRVFLRRVLEKVEGVAVVGEAGDGDEALALARALRPHAAFLDVEMPGMKGDQVARCIFEMLPRTCLVFATAHLDYTFAAFEVYAFDYLIKPFKVERIIQTMERIKAQVARNAAAAREAGQRLVIRVGRRLVVVDPREVVMVTREERKTIIYTTRRVITTNENLDGIEQKLKPGRFFRSHRGYIINLAMVKEIVPWGSGNYCARLHHTQEMALVSAERARQMLQLLSPGG